MKVNIRDNLSIKKEDYIELDDDPVGIFDKILTIIDDSKLAAYTNLFVKWDDIFYKEDFLYDFGSIACYLEDLEVFIENRVGEFTLNFYEKNRLIKFFFKSNKLMFKLFDTSKNERELLIYEGELPFEKFRFMIIKLRNDFILILKVCFPEGYRALKSENYVV